MGMLATAENYALYPGTSASSSIYRHHSYEPRRKIRRRPTATYAWSAAKNNNGGAAPAKAFDFADYDDEDDIFGAGSPFRSPSASPQPPSLSLRASPMPRGAFGAGDGGASSTCSTASVANASVADFFSLSPTRGAGGGASEEARFARATSGAAAPKRSFLSDDVRFYGRGADVDADDDDEFSAAAADFDDAREERAIGGAPRRKFPPPQQPQHQMRSFNVDSRGRITDCGFRASGAAVAAAATARHASRPLTRPSHKSRRATCPEIWLSSADDEDDETDEHNRREKENARPVTRCLLRVFGAPNTGKKTLARQMAAHADADACNRDAMMNLDYDDVALPASNLISFMMNDEEVELEVLQQGATPRHSNALLTVYMVVYSVDSRDSFVRAAQTLYRLHDSRRLAPNAPVILVANKVDLQRKRKVTFIEGKMLAKIYKSAFVETSSLLSMNMDRVWEETLRKLQKHKNARERQLRAIREAHGKQAHQSIMGTNNRLMGKIVRQGRRFAKSCEEIVRQIAAL